MSVWMQHHRGRKRRNWLAESKKWCLQWASCGIVIFTVSTSGNMTRSTVTIKQAASLKEGAHLLSPLPHLWSRNSKEAKRKVNPGVGNTQLYPFSRTNALDLSSGCNRFQLIIALTNNSLWWSRRSVCNVEYRLSGGTCILNSTTNQSCGGDLSQVTLCLSSDKWQVKPGGAHRRIPQRHVSRTRGPSRQLSTLPFFLRAPPLCNHNPHPAMHPLFSALAAPSAQPWLLTSPSRRLPPLWTQLTL